MAVFRINATSAFESFTSSPKTNYDVVKQLTSVDDLRKQLRDMPYFTDASKLYSVGWLAFPVDNTRYILFLYQFDENTGAVFNTFKGIIPISKYSDIWSAVQAEAAAQHVLDAPYVWEVDGKPISPMYAAQLAKYPELVPFIDSYLAPHFEEAKQEALGFFKPFYDPTLPQSIDAVRVHMRTKGGPITYNGKTGIPVVIDYDYDARKYRAKSNDGVHGVMFVRFPNDAREDGAVYLIPAAELKLPVNGKNYVVSNSLPLAKYRID